MAALVSCGHSHDGEESGTGHQEHVAAGGDEKGGHVPHEGIYFSKAQAAAAGLRTETVSPGEFREVIRTGGQIEAAMGDEYVVAATSAGVVSYPPAVMTEGAAVAKGSTVVTISARNLTDGDPSQKAKIAYETAKKDYERASKLVEDRIISQKEYEQARLSYEQARAAYGAHAANMTPAGVRVGSPISGYVKSRMVGNGEYVSVGQPVMTVTKNRRMQLRADVPERFYGRLASIKDANFAVPHSNKVYRMDNMGGKLLSYGKASGGVSPYIPVIFEFNNTADVMPGAYVEVYLLSDVQEGVLSVPVSALTEEQGLYFVYIREGAEDYHKREVTVGDGDGERVRVLSGLKPGEKVVVRGAYQVKLAAMSAVMPESHGHSH